MPSSLEKSLYAVTLGPTPHQSAAAAAASAFLKIFATHGIGHGSDLFFREAGGSCLMSLDRVAALTIPVMRNVKHCQGAPPTCLNTERRSGVQKWFGGDTILLVQLWAYLSLSSQYEYLSHDG